MPVRSRTSGVQLDLFIDPEPDPDGRPDPDVEAALDARWHQLTRGHPGQGWRCWVCGHLEDSEAALTSIHGWERARPARWTPTSSWYRPWCTRIDLLHARTRNPVRCTCAGDCHSPQHRRPGAKTWSSVSPARWAGRHCDCTGHDHSDCSTPDHCVALVEADARRAGLTTDLRPPTPEGNTTP